MAPIAHVNIASSEFKAAPFPFYAQLRSFVPNVGNPVGAWCWGDARGHVSESWMAVGFNFPEADFGPAVVNVRPSIASVQPGIRPECIRLAKWLFKGKLSTLNSRFGVDLRTGCHTR